MAPTTGLHVTLTVQPRPPTSALFFAAATDDDWGAAMLLGEWLSRRGDPAAPRITRAARRPPGPNLTRAAYYVSRAFLFNGALIGDSDVAAPPLGEFVATVVTTYKTPEPRRPPARPYHLTPPALAALRALGRQLTARFPRPPARRGRRQR